ncbi:MAG: radical SAM protein [Clostridiales bacterium]|nr:radical SAM protein [Clostridiales bacterium]
MKYDSYLKQCKLCIRNCNVDRTNGKVGFCKADDKIKIARADLHFWEEPPISAGGGSGAIFFSHCNLKCVFCQNHEISQEYNGISISINRLSEIFLELQEKGANNINLVTPTHYVPQIKEAIELAKQNGLSLPILYNTNGYDSLNTIKSLKGYIDVYLPDFKYVNNDYSVKYSNAPHYFENILTILKEMVAQTGGCSFDDEGKILKGVIIRHLMIPGLLFDSKKVIDNIINNFGDKVYISIMNQYIPLFKASEYPEINKKLNPKHYASLIEYATSNGISNGFIQDDGTDIIDFIPSFNLKGVLKDE